MEFPNSSLLISVVSWKQKFTYLNILEQKYFFDFTAELKKRIIETQEFYSQIKEKSDIWKTVFWRVVTSPLRLFTKCFEQFSRYTIMFFCYISN